MRMCHICTLHHYVRSLCAFSALTLLSSYLHKLHIVCMNADFSCDDLDLLNVHKNMHIEDIYQNLFPLLDFPSFFLNINIKVLSQIIGFSLREFITSAQDPINFDPDPDPGSALGKNGSGSGVGPLKVGNRTISDNKDMATELNKAFCSVLTRG